MRMEENKRKKSKKGVGRKPKSDPAVHRYVVRLNSEENGRFDIQFQKSGLKERSKFIKTMIFGKEIKVVKIDKATIDLVLLSKRIIMLTREFEDAYLIKRKREEE